MEYDRPRALGRWAEYVGPCGVDQDNLMRRARPRRELQGRLRRPQRRDPRHARRLRAGVNAFIASTPSLPIEFRLLGARPEPWEPWHVLRRLQGPARA